MTTGGRGSNGSGGSRPGGSCGGPAAAVRPTSRPAPVISTRLGVGGRASGMTSGSAASSPGATYRPRGRPVSASNNSTVGETPATTISGPTRSGPCTGRPDRGRRQRRAPFRRSSARRTLSRALKYTCSRSATGVPTTSPPVRQNQSMPPPRSRRYRWLSVDPTNRASRGRMPCGRPDSARSQIGAPVSSASTATRPSASGANSRPPAMAGRTVATPSRARRHSSRPSKPRRTTISPASVAAASQPLLQSGGAAIGEPRSALQSANPSEARQPPSPLPRAVTTTPPPVAGGWSSPSSIVQAGAPDSRSTATRVSFRSPT